MGFFCGFIYLVFFFVEQVIGADVNVDGGVQARDETVKDPTLRTSVVATICHTPLEKNEDINNNVVIMLPTSPSSHFYEKQEKKKIRI